jgi:hypothetical protein
LQPSKSRKLNISNTYNKNKKKTLNFRPTKHACSRYIFLKRESACLE